MFQQGSAPAHGACKTADLLTIETQTIPPTLWPPNSLYLHPVDYKVRSLMQERVCKGWINDVNELR